jgi:uncharacterized protein
MRILDATFVLSPTDLSNFLACRHRAGLDVAAALKLLHRPAVNNPYAAILKQHGADHEQSYVDRLEADGLSIVNASRAAGADPGEPTRLTLDAMKAGADVIVQARLEADGFAGYADILRRIDTPSGLGAWSYEVQDTKLARETKAGTILQLSAYSDMVGRIQGRTPEHFHVVTPIAVERYRVEDYAAYYRMVLATLRAGVEKGHEALIAAYYPEPVDACALCAWEARCEARRRQDDHLSYIAGVGRSQRVELTTQGVATLTLAAGMPVPVAFTPARGSRETYNRLGDQARVQHQQRTEKRPIVERLAVVENEGLCRLPEPSPGDLFLDLEGARFAREGGREYLFGVWTGRDYLSWWALDDAEEQAAFEAVIDAIMAAWKTNRGMHVYHFNHYEPTAFKKLMGRYVTRGEQLDKLLRAERFVDLYPVARQAVRAGVESYSIKKLEQYYGYTRRVELKNVHEPLLAVEQALDANAPGAITAAIRDAVQGYNEDDCRSTLALRDWLESLRTQWEAEGVAVPRPQDKSAEAEKPVPEVQQQAVALRERLLATIPAEAFEPTHAEHPKWLLAYLIDWHRREVNSEWWEFFRLKRLPEEDLFDERDAVAGLAFVERIDIVRRADNQKPTGSVIDRYTYRPQEIEIGRKGKLKLQNDEPFGEIVAHDRVKRLLDVKKGKKAADTHPNAAFSCDVVTADGLQKSVMRLAERVIAGADECGAQLLFRNAPRLRGGAFAMKAGESEQDFAVGLATMLDRTTLPIQGPPGAGKTYVGAQMILALVKAGKKVGVTATSHKVIRNLLDEVVAQGGRTGQPVKVGQKPREVSEQPGPVVEYSDNPPALTAIAEGEVDVLGGTPFMWARDEFAHAVDVLFVDEAGQMSLANVLAVSQAADSLVLLGDPQQLDQPEKATHPDGVGVSALQHVLGERETMPADRGIFLPVTWRMSPALTLFTSELFYEGKLTAKAGLERQVLSGGGRFEGSKLWMVPVDHDGCQSASDEEVTAVASVVEQLLTPAATWIGDNGEPRPLTGADIRVVAPFNAQVNRITERLNTLWPEAKIQVGTVDKFQGQTCAVVIYSMATSRPEDAPRGMEFLYSLNRLNVATSRARCAVFLVASPRLFEPQCRTPRQMQLANALCRYMEMATLVS